MERTQNVLRLSREGSMSAGALAKMEGEGFAIENPTA